MEKDKLSTSPKYQTPHFISREDSGMFQCSASNEAGYITGYTWLRVKSKFFFLSLELLFRGWSVRRPSQ